MCKSRKKENLRTDVVGQLWQHAHLLSHTGLAERAGRLRGKRIILAHPAVALSTVTVPYCHFIQRDLLYLLFSSHECHTSPILPVKVYIVCQTMKVLCVSCRKNRNNTSFDNLCRVGRNISPYAVFLL
jgi:hypothetical protein